MTISGTLPAIVFIEDASAEPPQHSSQSTLGKRIGVRIADFSADVQVQSIVGADTAILVENAGDVQLKGRGGELTGETGIEVKGTRAFIANNLISRRSMSSLDDSAKGFVASNNGKVEIRNSKALGYKIGFEILGNDSVLLDNNKAISLYAHALSQRLSHYIEDLKCLPETGKGKLISELSRLNEALKNNENPSIIKYLVDSSMALMVATIGGYAGDNLPEIYRSVHDLLSSIRF